MKLRRRTLFAGKGLCTILMLSTYLACPLLGLAQEPAGADTSKGGLPDSPKPQTSTAPTQDTTTRVIGYMTNRSILFPTIATDEKALTPASKFKLFVNQSISPPYLFLAGISAAYDQARDVPKGYGQGWGAYGGRYGQKVARSSSNSFFSTFLFASALHQDPRFFPQIRPTLWGSVKYSTQRVFITRTDSGVDTFNTSGVAGTVAAEGLANAYLPDSDRTAGQTCERIGVDFAWKIAGNMFQNYWPTVFHNLGLNRLGVIPNPGGAPSPAPTN
jgi:hypothetical protein